MTLAKTADHWGFLTCTEFEGLGLCGGLLLVNQVARPLEFHCTLPVKVTRTQSILYGASLRPYVCGQVIGRALIDKAKTAPHLLVTDSLETAEVRQTTDLPVVLLMTSCDSGPPQEVATDDWARLEVEGIEAYLGRSSNGDLRCSEVQTWLLQYAQRNDLREPFERVRQAISEAHDAARRAA